MAALFFARLYDVTNDPQDREWAIRTLLWMDTVLYDNSTHHLYRWSVSYADIPNRSGSTLSERYFNYDQGIAIQAQLAAFAIDRDATRVARARAIGDAITTEFWSKDIGGLNLEAGIQQVYTGFSAWTSLGHLALFELDHDPRWLDQARANADAMDKRLRSADGG